MRRKIIYLLLIIYVGFLSVNDVFADDITCDYENGLKIIYYESGSVEFDYNELKSKWYNTNSVLFDIRTEMYTTEEIYLNQDELFEIYNNYGCPETLYLCEDTSWGIEHPSLVGIADGLGMTLSDLVSAFSLGNLSFRDVFEDNAWSLLLLNKKKLTIVSQEDYENNYKNKEGTYPSSSFGDGYAVARDWCTFGDDIPVLEQVTNFGCGTVWGTVKFIGDTIYNDDEQMLIGIKNLSCSYVKYPSDGQYQGINISCAAAMNNIELLKDHIDEYNICNDSECRLSNKIKINKLSEQTRFYCNKILSDYSYIGSQKRCIDSCLNLSEVLNKMDDSDLETVECGFSSRLIIWIGNIIRWMKYLVPVLVIVLGILDFIKAISGDKDDEMKKAQGRFVKRLIAAALIFITPFIIEFLLDVMGFDKYIEGCGILDL